MNNVKSIISSHNKTVISKSTNSDEDKKNCNCRKPETCPMDGNCNVESIIVTVHGKTYFNAYPLNG